jgi:alpha-D-ribose 1-methylphosphonate 5-phosphate C-P lyase
LKAVAIPGYQVPFGGREMPLSYGWGTGGIQVTASVIGPDDVLKVIDQGADDTTNAVSIRKFFQHTARVRTTTRTSDATIIQTRHRIPETPLARDQILVLQVPIPEPLRWLEPREAETRKMHALEEYGVMHVRLYEDITRHGKVAQTYEYPVVVNERYLMRPSPIPKFDNPKLDRNPALLLFGAGREKRIYAVPPYTKVRSLDFEDHPFEVERWNGRARSAERWRHSWTRSWSTTRAAGCSSAPTPTSAGSARGAARTARGDGDGRALRSFACAGSRSSTGRAWAASTLGSTSGQGRCSGWSASPARGRRRSSIACPVASSPAPGAPNTCRETARPPTC